MRRSVPRSTSFFAMRPRRALDAADPERSRGRVRLDRARAWARWAPSSSTIPATSTSSCSTTPTAPRCRQDVEPAPFSCALTRDLVQLLQERTADGYVFRVDLRLRPDPGLDPARRLDRRRARLLREPRPELGARGADQGAAVRRRSRGAARPSSRELAPFVWRKYLDFAAIADIHSIKRQIHAYRGHGELAVAGHDLKLGRGGIREIEFFVQTQQLIAGGRHPELRGRETLDALAALAEGGWIDAEARGRARRRPTTSCARRAPPADDRRRADPHAAGRARGAARPVRPLGGHRGRDAFAEALLAHLRERAAALCRAVRDAPPLASAAAQPRRSPATTTTPRRSTGWPTRLPPAAPTSPRRAPLALRRATRRCARHRPRAADRARAAADRGLARAPTMPTPRSSPSTASWPRCRPACSCSALLAANPELLTLSPGHGHRAAARRHPRAAPDVLDALIDPSFFGRAARPRQPRAPAGGDARRRAGYEDVLDRARIFGQEQMFLIGVRVLAGTGVGRAGRRAPTPTSPRCCIRALHRRGRARISPPPTGASAAGSRRDRDGQARRPRDDRGLRSRPHPPLRFRREQLRSPTASGRCRRAIFRPPDPAPGHRDHAHDARGALRGRHAAAAVGPLRAARDPDRRVRRAIRPSEAWTWEHMALTRARVVCGLARLAARVDAVIARVLCRRATATRSPPTCVEMRRRDRAEKGEDERLGPQVRRRRPGRHRVHRAVPAARPCRALPGNPRHLDGRACSTRRRGSACWRPRTPRCCGRRRGSITTSRRSCASACRARSIRNRAGAGLLARLARAADVPDFPALEAHPARNPEAEVRAKLRPRDR